ncbi:MULTISPECIES: lipocalin family protein [Bacteroides]|nr:MULTISPECIES: lipocalin family protein [Bacteroides]MDE6823062.1 hypothetical protein [Bacteroides acidifaciens]
MKTLRFIGMAIVAVIMCVNFAACSDDEDESGNAASLIGTWKIEKVATNGVEEEWDGYPYFVITDTHCYFTDEEDIEKSDYCTYTYDTKSKVMHCKYVSSDTEWDIKVLSLSNSTVSVQMLEEGDIITATCKRVQ